MFAFFEFYGITVYTFWISLSIIFFLFLWMLNKLAKKDEINFSFFTNHILSFFISTIVFSRIFYVLSNWDEWKFINNFFDFFVMEDYNFSLFWAVFWFLLVLFFSLKRAEIDYKKYLDISVISLFFVLVFWYLWALMWWQVIWKPTDFWIELVYSSPNAATNIWVDVPVFPLAIVYSILSFIIFSILYSLLLFVKTRGFIGFIWLMLLWTMIFTFDSFSYWAREWELSFNQMIAIAFIVIPFYFLWWLNKVRKRGIVSKKF
jgi:hypothetical protein